MLFCYNINKLTANVNFVKKKVEGKKKEGIHIGKITNTQLHLF